MSVENGGRIGQWAKKKLNATGLETRKGGIASQNSTVSFNTFIEVKGGMFVLPYPKLQIEL